MSVGRGCSVAVVGEEGRVASSSVGTALDPARLAVGSSDDADDGVSLGVAVVVGFDAPGRCSPPPCCTREGFATVDCVAVSVVVRVVVAVMDNVGWVGSCASTGSWAKVGMEASAAPWWRWVLARDLWLRWAWRM